MSQALYRKWRPARFNDVIGQEHVTRTLQNSVSAGRVGHAYLMCGPRGTGKTTTARLIAKAVNCLHDDLGQRPCNTCSVCISINEGRFLDLIEIDAASNTGVDDIRDLRDKINFSPSAGRLKVYIIDEVHMLSTAAFNALLKTLEEPPPHAMFVLATTEEHKVPLTIKSRCQQFNFRLLTESEIVSRLNWLAEQESLQIEPAAVSLMARQGAGSLRDAESLLDQLVTSPGDVITLARAQAVLGTATDDTVATLTDAWLEGNGAAGLSIIHDALASGTDARQFCRQMVVYLRELLLIQAAGADVDAAGQEERQAAMLAQAQRSPRQKLIDAIKKFNEAAVTPAGSWQPQLPLELAFIEMLPESPLYVQPVGTAAVVNKPTVAPTSSKAKVPAVEVKPEVKAADTPTAETGAAPDQSHAPVTAPEPAAAPVAKESVRPMAEAAAADGTFSFEQVKHHWRDMLAEVGQSNKNMPALLNMGRPLAIEGMTVVLGFDYPIFKEKFDNTASAAELIAESLSRLLQIKCAVRSVVTSEYPIIVSKEEFQALAQELGGVVSEDSGE